MRPLVALGAPLPARPLAAARARLLALLLALLVGWAVAWPGAPVLHADPPPTAPNDRAPDAAPPEGPAPGAPDPVEVDLVAELLAAESDGQWRGTHTQILAKPPDWIGRNLGRVFDRNLDAERMPCVAFVAAYLADNPVNERGGVHLAAEIVHRAQGDEAFLRQMRKHLTRGQGGWDRLQARAREMLGSERVRDRRAAVWFLSQQDSQREERVREALFLLLERAGREGPEGGEGATAESLAQDYLDAFARLLAYRFSNLPEAVRVLEQMREQSLYEIALALSRRKGQALDERRFQIERELADVRIAQRDPAGLLRWFDAADADVVPGIRLYVVQQAAALQPAPAAPWKDFLCRALDVSRDPEVLRATLDILERPAFSDPPDVAVADALARCVVARLRRGGDGHAERVRLAKVLGGLRLRSRVLEAIQDATAGGAHHEILAELVRVLGGVKDVMVEDVVRHWRAHPPDTEAGRQVRLAVVDALGRQGLRATDPAAAAAALREILTGHGERQLGRASTPDARSRAMHSLQHYPGAETAEVLREAALAPDRQESHTAIQVLAVLMHRDPAGQEAAVRALAEVAEARNASADPRVKALEALERLDPPGAPQPRPVTPEVRERVHAAVRGVLQDPEAAVEVRAQAAATAAALADGGAIEPMRAWWEAQPDEKRLGALRRLVAEVARRTDGHDDALAALVRRVGRREPGGWDAAESLARAAYEATTPARARIVLVLAQALAGRAGSEGRDVQGRRKDLRDAVDILRRVGSDLAEERREEALLLRVVALRTLAELPGTEDVQRKDLYLEAVRLSSDRGRGSESARAALPAALALLNPPLAGLLDADERQQVEQARTALDQRALDR